MLIHLRQLQRNLHDEAESCSVWLNFIYVAIDFDHVKTSVYATIK